MDLPFHKISNDWTSRQSPMYVENPLLLKELEEFEKQIDWPDKDDSSKFIPKESTCSSQRANSYGLASNIYVKNKKTSKVPDELHMLNDIQDKGIDYSKLSYPIKNSNLKQANKKSLICQTDNMIFRKNLFSNNAEREIDILDVELCMTRLAEYIHRNDSIKKAIIKRETSLTPLKMSIQKDSSKNIKTKHGFLGIKFDNEENTAMKLSIFLAKLLAYYGFDYVNLHQACLDEKKQFSWTRGLGNLTQMFEDALVADIKTKFWPQSISIKFLAKIVTDHFDAESKKKVLELSGHSNDMQIKFPVQIAQAKEVVKELYVGNLDFMVTSEEKLRSIFSIFGPIKKIIMSSPPLGYTGALHSGYVFLHYETADAVEFALEATQISIDRRIVKIGRTSNLNDCSGPLRNLIIGLRKEAEGLNFVYAANVNSKLSHKDLNDVFGSFGDIITCILPTFHNSNLNRGFCYIQFSNAASVISAVEAMHLRDFAGRKLRVRQSNILSEQIYLLAKLDIPLPLYLNQLEADDYLGSNDAKVKEKLIAHDLMKVIFIGNLDSSSTTEKQLYSEFSPFGPITRIQIIHEPSNFGTSTFGFVDYFTADAAELSLEMDGVMVNDNEIRVRRKNKEEEYRLVIDKLRAEALNQNWLYVANLSPNVTETNIKATFGAFGSISNVHLLTHRKSQHTEKFCYIQYTNKTSKEDALQRLNLFDVDGRKMRLGHAITTEEEIKLLFKKLTPLPDKVLEAIAYAEKKIVSDCSSTIRSSKLSDSVQNENIAMRLNDCNEVEIIEIKREKKFDETMAFEDNSFKRKRDWKNERSNLELPMKKSTRWSDSQSAFPMYLSLPPGLSKSQEHAFMLQIKVTEITQDLQTNRQEYSFEQRKLKEEERHQYIQAIRKVVGNYKTPSDYIKANFDKSNWLGTQKIFTEDVILPTFFGDKSNSTNYAGLLIGPTGSFLKWMIATSGVRAMRLKGKGVEKSTSISAIDTEAPPHVHIIAKDETSLKEGSRMIKILLKEISDSPCFVEYLRMQQTLLAHNRPQDYLPENFFEGDEWKYPGRLPYENVYIPVEKADSFKMNLRGIEIETSTKMEIMGVATYSVNEMPLHVHIVSKLKSNVLLAAQRIRIFMQETAENNYIRCLSDESLQYTKLSES